MLVAGMRARDVRDRRQRHHRVAQPVGREHDQPEFVRTRVLVPCTP